MQSSAAAPRRRWHHSAALFLWMARAGPPPIPPSFPVCINFFPVPTQLLGAANDH